MIFSELYSAYYNTVSKILKKAAESDMTEKDLRAEVMKNAFSESMMTIIPALKTEKWQLLHEDRTPVVFHTPTMPLTLLEKRWLKAIMNDPRIRLFDISLPELQDIEPLFTREDYNVFDQYADGDPFENETYIKHFRMILQAIKEKRAVEVTMENRRGKEFQVHFYPTGFEYSLKDDKMRITASGYHFQYFNLARIRTCTFYTGNGPWTAAPEKIQKRNLTLMITDERNALERVMLHFSHFEKQAERLDEKHYILKMTYSEKDETEIVIRILSFGPCVKVMEPSSFVDLIKERLYAQKSCELK